MNSSILSGKWKEIKGEIQKTWGELTSDEIDRTQGNATSLIGLIEQKFGLAKDEASKKIHELLGRYEDKAEVKTETLSDKVNAKIEDVKQSVRETNVAGDAKTNVKKTDGLH